MRRKDSASRLRVYAGRACTVYERPGVDNVTHGLIGITLARSLPITDPAERRAAVWTAVLASNIPDLDFLVPAFLGDPKLAYLLHHRGYTHTLLLLFPIAAAAVLAGSAIARTPARGWLFLVAIACVVLHVAADWPNNYGVHPFHPFSERWLYGDFVFIIEPALWFAMLPLAIQRSNSNYRWFAVGLWLLMLGVAWLGPFMPWFVAICATLWAIGIALAQHRIKANAIAWSAVSLVYLSFFIGSRLARAEATGAIGAAEPEEVLVDLATTAAPSNPFCWQAIAETRAGDDHVVRLGAISLVPWLVDPETCFARLRTERTAPLSPPSLVPSRSHAWAGEFRAPVPRIQEVLAGNCRLRTLFGFVRFPYWIEREGRITAGDLRYDFEPGLGFAEFEMALAESCPDVIPPWGRAPLF